MRNSGRLVDILDRMENGVIADEKEFDLKIVASGVKRFVKEFGISFDGINLVNTDNDMADRCFQAGLKLAVHTGVFCKSNGRRLMWSEREILETIQGAPSSLLIGFGHDARLEQRRNPEDSLPPIIIAGPLGTPLREDQFIPVMMSYIQEPLTDTTIAGTLETVYGRDPRTRSPWEILSGWLEAELMLTAARRVGREGMSFSCVVGAVSDVTQLSATSRGGYRPTDWHQIAMISELKTNYELLNKLTHMVQTDSIIHSFCNPIFGGLAGGAEGLAVIEAAGLILLQMLYMTTTHSQCPTHPMFMCNTSPEIIWSTGLSIQALSRNSPFMLDGVVSPVGGPCTKTLLYETAAMVLAATSSGAARLMGPRSTAGKFCGHVTGLEGRFMGEVGHAAAGMSRLQANEIVKQLVPMYKDQLGREPKGVSFEEAYDLRTLQPKPEWLAIYDEVKREVSALGVARLK
jgi:methylamine---corrinoid protein Co-methyltransferase